MPQDLFEYAYFCVLSGYPVVVSIMTVAFWLQADLPILLKHVYKHILVETASECFTVS